MIRTTGFTAFGDRYVFDFKLCTAAKGWAHFDTKQDAHYHGIWVNPITLEYVSYVEGDQTHIQYANEGEFVDEVREAVNWHRERGYFLGIDGMRRPSIIEAFQRMDLNDLLH